MIRKILAASLMALALLACGKEQPVAGALPGSELAPVIIISVDTLRADRLPAYGYTGVKTPAIDALVADSIVFENAYAHVPLTLPSHVTMLTGLLPEATGVRNNLGYRFDGNEHANLPSMLKAKGFATGAAVSAYVMRSATGLGALFDDYDDRIDRSSEGGSMGELERSGDQTVASAIQWIEEKKEQPFFYLLHLFEPHAPYEPIEPYRTQYASSPYDGEIATTDFYLERFFQTLKANGVYDRATIIFLSDHGEGLGDHGEAQHGIFLYREAIHVPMIVKLPNGAMKGTRVEAPVQLIDLLPTVAGLAGFEVPEKATGVSLVEIARGNAPEGRRIYSESMYPRIHLGWSDLASLIDEQHHYIDAPRPELYDIRADPGEKQNILSEQRRVYASMRAEVQKHPRTLELPANIDPEEAAKLAALGYLGSTGASTSGKLPDPKDGIADLERTGKANALVAQGKHKEAIAILEDVVARNPSFADAWTQLGKALDRTGRPDEAIAAYKKTIEVAPMLVPGTAMSMAEVFLRMGRFDDSISHAELALPAHPSAARMLMAQVHLARRDFPAAEREAQALMADRDRRNDASVLLAQVRIAQRRLPEAGVILDGVKQQADAEGKQVPPNFWFARGDTLARMSKFPEAEQSFREEIRLYPRNREAYVRLAVLQTLTGREGDATQTFEQMVRANPGESSYALAAETFRELKKPDAARKWSARGR